jgi:hypothetical protein
MRPSRFAHFWQSAGAESIAPASLKTMLERATVARTCSVFTIVTSKCHSRHSGVQFLKISTSKSAPKLVFFSHFDFDMCFAPQPCALFQHVNFRKCSEPKVSYNILTSTRAWRDSSVHFFDISTSKSAPRMRWFEHFDFQICFAPQRLAIFHLTSAQMGLRTRRFSEPIYFSTLLSHKSLEKQRVSRLSYLFAHLHLLSSDLFSSLLFICP